MTDIGRHQKWFTSPLNLGGVPGPGGGSGIPIGGLIGQLIQSKVAYDTTEAITLTLPPSGRSLVHNLNRIRYWLTAKSDQIVVLDDGSQVASGVRVLDFIGAPVTVNLASGYTDRVDILISGTGGGGGGTTVKISADDTVANYLEDKVVGGTKITISTLNPGGDEDLEVAFDGLAIAEISDITITSPADNEVLAYDTGGDWINQTPAEANLSEIGHTHVETDVTNLDHDAQKIKGIVVSGVTPDIGEALRYDGAIWVPSGLGAAIDNYTAKISSDDTTPDYLDQKIIAGSNIVVTTQSPGGDEYLEISSTASGGGGSALEIKDEGSTLTASGVSIDFTGSAVTATASGTAVTVDIPGMIVDIPAFIGTRYIWTAETQTNTGGYWTDLTWDEGDYDGTVIYNEPSSWEYVPWHRMILVPEQGYYNISASVTISGATVPALANRNMSLNLFEEGGATVAADTQLRASGVQTFHINTTIFINSPTDETYLSLFNGGHNESVYPYVLSGSFTNVALHKIQGSVIGIEGVRATQINSGSITISDDTVTDLDFEGEQYDLSDFWDTGDRATFTIPSSGYYNVQGLMTWDKWGGGTDRKFLMERNGSDILAQAQAVHPGPNDTKELSQTLSTDAFFGAGDTVKFRVWHNRGENLNIIAGSAAGSACNATITKIGRP
jgi:hypothetical protein